MSDFPKPPHVYSHTLLSHMTRDALKLPMMQLAAIYC